MASSIGKRRGLAASPGKVPGQRFDEGASGEERCDRSCHVGSEWAVGPFKLVGELRASIDEGDDVLEIVVVVVPVPPRSVNASSFVAQKWGASTMLNRLASDVDDLRARQRARIPRTRKPRISAVVRHDVDVNAVDDPAADRRALRAILAEPELA